MTLQTPIRFVKGSEQHSAFDREARDLLYGPAPLNPFKQLRCKNSMTLVALASQARVDRKALTRLESGMYTKPLPSVMDYWVKRELATEGELWTDYEDFQFEQRKRHPHYFGRYLKVDLNGQHPFRQLRAKRPSVHDPELLLPVGLTECAENLCLPLDTLQFFEKKYRLQQSVPRSVKQVLSQIGYTRLEINEFESNYKEWRSNNNQVIMS